MNLISEILPWVMWLVGTLGVAGALAFIMLVPGGLTLLVEFLRPHLKLAGEATAGYAHVLWEGAKDVFDSWRTIAFVGTLCLGSFFGGWYYNNSICDEVPENVRIDYKLIKRTPAEKKAYLNSKGYSSTYTWWRSWF